jgi:hypothetical protein
VAHTAEFHILGAPVTAAPASFARRLSDERGTTLIETAIASGILLVMLAGLLSMGTIATMHTENQGHLTPRTTEYAQDKMEQLLGLAYGDATSNTVNFPATSTGGTGLAAGGSGDTANPVNGYVDWLSNDGSLLGGGTTPPTTWFYERVWQITSPSGGVKQIAVTVTVRSSVGGFMLAKSTIVALKASQF